MSDQGTKPLSADDFFGGSGSSGQDLTADDAFAPTPSKPMGGEAWDHVFSRQGFSDANATVDKISPLSLSNVLSDFGHGFSQNWGAYSSEATEQRDAAMKPFLNSVNTVHSSIAKAFNEAIIRPAAYDMFTATAALKEAALGLSAAILGGAEQVAAGAGERTGHAALGREAAGMIEAGAQGAYLPTGIPPVPEEVSKAKSLGIIGSEERIEPTGSGLGLGDETAAIRGQVDQQKEGPPEPTTVPPEEPQMTPGSAPSPSAAPVVEVAPEATETPQKPQPDLETAAREINPRPFQQTDALLTRQENYRQWLQDLGEQRGESDAAKEAQAKIDTILGKVNGVEDRLTGVATDRLQAAREDLVQATARDTPDMAFVRKKLLETQQNLWDLAPEMQAARREALANMHEESAETTSLETAAPVADEVRQIVDTHAHELSTEAHDELTGNPEAEAAGIAGTDEDIAGSPNESEALGVRPGRVSPTGEEPTGGNEIATEGDQVRRREAAEGESKSPKINQFRTTGVKGTGETKTRGLAVSTDEFAKAAGFDGSENLPEYEVAEREQQNKMFQEVLDKEGYDAGKAIAMGNRTPPRGMLASTAYRIMRRLAKEKGDGETLNDLANKSKLLRQATTAGQFIQAFHDNDPDSPIAAMQEVQQARVSAYGGNIEAAKKPIMDEGKAAIKEAAPKTSAWSDFLDSIQC